MQHSSRSRKRNIAEVTMSEEVLSKPETSARRSKRIKHEVEIKQPIDLNKMLRAMEEQNQRLTRKRRRDLFHSSKTILKSRCAYCDPVTKRKAIELYYGKLGGRVPLMHQRAAARELRMAFTTFRTLIKKYQQNDFVLDTRRANNKVKFGKLMPIKHKLLDSACLRDWAHMSLHQRCQKILADHQIKVSHTHLLKFYRHHKVSYVKPGYKLWSSATEDKLLDLRIAFIKDLGEAILSDTEVFYFDETSFNLWMRQVRTWQSSQDRFKMTLAPNTRNLTLLGAISTHRARLHYTIGAKTDEASVLRFLASLYKVTLG